MKKKKNEAVLPLTEVFAIPWEAPIVPSVEVARAWGAELGQLTLADPSNIDDVLEFIRHQIRRSPLEGVTMMRHYGLTCELSRHIDPLTHHGMQKVTQEFMKHLDVAGLMQASNESLDAPKKTSKKKKTKPVAKKKRK